RRAGNPGNRLIGCGDACLVRSASSIVLQLAQVIGVRIGEHVGGSVGTDEPAERNRPPAPRPLDRTLAPIVALARRRTRQSRPDRPNKAPLHDSIRTPPASLSPSTRLRESS